MLEGVYVVSYSESDNTFSLLCAKSRHIIEECSDFGGIYKKVKQLKQENKSGSVDLHFSDSCIDELQRRNRSVKGGI